MGGGATSSDAFENLTQSEKEKINEYLIRQFVTISDYEKIIFLHLFVLL